MAGNHSDGRCSFLTILDNVLTICETAGGEKRAGRPQPQSGGFPKGAGWGAKNGAAANVAEALRRKYDCCKNTLTSPGPTLKKAKNKSASIYNGFIFICVFRELSKHTPYMMCIADRHSILT